MKTAQPDGTDNAGAAAEPCLTSIRRQSMKRQTPVVGALFTVPLPDDSFVIGQIVGREAQVLNAWTCGFSRSRSEKAVAPKGALLPADVVSVLFVTGDLLKSGRWKIYAQTAVQLPKSYFPYEEFRANGWIGAKMIGSGIIDEVDPESWTPGDGHPKSNERNRPPFPANDASIVPR